MDIQLLTFQSIGVLIHDQLLLVDVVLHEGPCHVGKALQGLYK